MSLSKENLGWIRNWSFVMSIVQGETFEKLIHTVYNLIKTKCWKIESKTIGK